MSIIKRKRRDLSGQKFGRLTAISEFYKEGSHKYYWVCKCDCGKSHNVMTSSLLSGNTRSCGCYNREVASKINLIHGMSRRGADVRLYKIWVAMLDRCNPETPCKSYSDRGIRVCEEWKDISTFMKWSNENGYTNKLTIDRINNDGNYEPNNCRWADMKTQGRNRRTNRNVTLNGVTKCVTEWCEIYEVNFETVRTRLNNGWGDLESFETRPHQRRKEVKQ